MDLSSASYHNIDRGNEAVRRATLTGEEYEQLCSAMQVYCIGENGGLDTAECLQRQLVQHYVLIAATSGLRVGEQLQLRWSDVEIETHRDKQGNPISLSHPCTSGNQQGTTQQNLPLSQC